MSSIAAGEACGVRWTEVRDDALLAHALQGRWLAAYLLIPRVRGVQSVAAEAWNCDVSFERPEYAGGHWQQIRLPRTIYYLLAGNDAGHAIVVGNPEVCVDA